MNEQINGKDIIHIAKINKQMAINGGNYRIDLERPIPCTECNGTGKKHLKKCKKCNGLGLVRERSTLNFQIPKIPQGMHTGDKLTIPGKGEVGRNGGTDGNLIVMIEVEE